MATNKRKETLCKQYGYYLAFIYVVGNKVILMKQLYEFAQATKLARHYPDFHAQIQELVDADVLRKEEFEVSGRITQHIVLVLGKYAIRYLERKQGSQSVGAVPKANNNERILTSIFKVSYLLNEVLPNREDFQPYFAENYSSLLYSKNKGAKYLLDVRERDLQFLRSHFDLRALKETLEIMQSADAKRREGLQKGAKATKERGKGKGRERSDYKRGKAVASAVNENKKIMEAKEQKTVRKDKKTAKLNSYNIDSMLNAHIYIERMSVVNGVFSITVLMYDIHNKQDIYTMATNMACVYQMFFNQLRNEEFKIHFKVVAFDEEAQRNFETQAEKKVYDSRTKELKGKQLPTILENWHVYSLDQENVTVTFENYDVTNRYMEGIKYANLLQTGRAKGSKNKPKME